MNVAISMPSPWKETPAIRMGRACLGGWDGPRTVARVPDNIMGKMGRIHCGVIDWTVRGCPV